MISLRTQGIVLLFALSLITACGGGGGGGGGDTGGGGGGGADTIALTSSGTIIYIEKSALDPLSGYDPWIRAHFATSNATTYIYLRNSCTGSPICSYNETFEIQFDGNTVTTGDIAAGTANIYYSKTSPPLSFGATTGTVEVTRYDAVAGHIQGTFIVSNGTSTMSGSFSVTREADQ